MGLDLVMGVGKEERKGEDENFCHTCSTTFNQLLIIMMRMVDENDYCVESLPTTLPNLSKPKFIIFNHTTLTLLW